MAGQHDVVVVGAGYWGVAIAYALRAAGADVLLVDADMPQASSRNSAGIFQAWWYKAETTAKKIPAGWDWAGPSVRWLQDLDLVRRTGEGFTTYQHRQQRLRDDCWLVDPEAVLALVKPVKVHVVRLWRDTGGWNVNSIAGVRAHAKQVVVAAGAWTDKLLWRSGLPEVGVQPLRGRAAIFCCRDNSELPITHLAAPFTHYTMRPFKGNKVRIGDTVERKVDGALPQTYLDTVERWGFDLGDALRWQDGFRPVTKQYVVDEVAPGLVVATGGHRVGLGLSEPVANRVKGLLGW